MDPNAAKYLLPLILLAVIMPLIGAIVLPMSYEMRRDMYKTLAIEAIRFCVLASFLHGKIDHQTDMLKLACILGGITMYYTLLDPIAVIHGKHVYDT